jgi:hypothetical protein
MIRIIDSIIYVQKTIIIKRTMIKNIIIFYASKNYKKNYDQERENTIEDKPYV